ncbi:MAG TPA: alpha/beta hydrolase [Miltoncostaeaceae bacterium]|nr:alpha/beta hydrolase [Miltoncostaeaceae bacterium]
MDEWIWTLGLGPAFAQFAPPGTREPVTGDPGVVPTKIGYRTIDGIRIRCAECGGGDATQSILMTCPWPESMYAFAQIWSTLAQRFRVHAMDLPGFGGSDRSDELLSPHAMGGFLARLIGDGEFGEQVHLVAPDVGTAAGLFAAARRPDPLLSVLVGGGGAAVPLRLTGPLAEWVSAPDLEPYRAMDPRAIVGAALDTIDGYDLPADIREDYLASYEGDRFVESMRYARTYPDELPALAAQLPEIATPVQIVAGARDRVVPLANAEFLHERLPHSRLAVVEAGHFVWEEAAGEYGSIVQEWATGGHREA